MNLERMQLMVTLLDEVIAGTWTPTEREGPVVFNLDTWGMPLPNTCGYYACAIGHAILDSRFQILGLKYLRGQPTLLRPNSSDEDADPDVLATGFVAVAHLFDICAGTAEILFSPYWYGNEIGVKKTPENVRDRILERIRYDQDDEQFTNKYDALMDKHLSTRGE